MKESKNILFSIIIVFLVLMGMIFGIEILLNLKKNIVSSTSIAITSVDTVTLITPSTNNALDITVTRLMEQAYYEGQRDYAKGDIKIKKTKMGYIYIKSCWDFQSNTNSLIFVPTPEYSIKSLEKEN